MRRDYVVAGIFWIALTVALELYYPTVSFYGRPASEEGILIDAAFDYLMVAAIPVFSFVVSVMVYSIIRFRVDEDDLTGSGQSHGNSNRVYILWTLVTSVLALAILIHPGITGVIELRSNNTADLIVEVTAEKWNWDFAYPQYGILLENTTELILPVDTRVHFQIRSKDILHSFWIPVFRMKMDAVPGLVTNLYTTPNLVGSFEDNFNFRVQCAELCGSGHARMRAGVVVLEQAEFDAWIEEVQNSE